MIDPGTILVVVGASIAVATLVDMFAVSWTRAVAARRRALTVPDPPATWRSVTVIVPAWREGPVLGACLEALAQVDYPDWEIVVVAGGDDATLALAMEASRSMPRMTVIEQAPLGKPAALNAGTRAARGEVIVLLDADSLVTPGWLRALVAPLRGGVRATTGNPVPSRSTAVSRTELMERCVVYDIRRSPILQGSGSIAIERSLLDELAGFPLDAYADDWDLDARLATRGIARAFAAGAVLRTERPATFAEFWANEVRWRRAHLISLFSLPHYFFRDVPAALRSLYPYLVAWGAAILTLTLVVAVLAGTGIAGTVAGLWVVMAAWVLLQRLVLVVEVVVYTRDRDWLRDAWAPPAIFVVTLIAACVASLTTNRATLHFKGPRRVVEDESGL